MIFLTGVTGSMGRELLVKVLQEKAEESICVLIRPEKDISAQERFKKILKETQVDFKAAEKVRVIEGDVSEEFFGLAESDFKNLAQRTKSIYHVAASTSLGQSFESAYKNNVLGTENVLKLGLISGDIQKRKMPFFHVSTAYVAGDVDRTVLPHELNLNAGFRNHYERSKAQAEALVRSHKEKLSVRIFRPSVVVGDSQTGKTSVFNVIYVPAKFIARGFFKIFPANPNIPTDLISVDYVANAIWQLSKLKEEEAQMCYHICVGVGRESSPMEIVQLIIEAVNKYCKEKINKLSQPPLIPFDIKSLANTSLSAAYFSVKFFEDFVGKKISMFQNLIPFLPYMNANPRFDISQTIKKLPEPPLFKSCGERLFRYCLETNWGKFALSY